MGEGSGLNVASKRRPWRESDRVIRPMKPGNAGVRRANWGYADPGAAIGSVFSPISLHPRIKSGQACGEPVRWHFRPFELMWVSRRAPHFTSHPNGEISMPNEADDPRRDDLLDRRSFVGIAALLQFMLARPSRGRPPHKSARSRTSRGKPLPRRTRCDASLTERRRCSCATRSAPGRTCG